jgi:hypothetical protein
MHAVLNDTTSIPSFVKILQLRYKLSTGQTGEENTKLSEGTRITHTHTQTNTHSVRRVSLTFLPAACKLIDMSLGYQQRRDAISQLKYKSVGC